MNLTSEILSEAYGAGTPVIAVAIAVIFLAIALLAPEQRVKRRSVLVMFGLHVFFVVLGGAFRAFGWEIERGMRLGALVFGTLSVIRPSATLVFAGVLPRARIHVPLILQDVVVAVTSVAAVFAVASRMGVNLSGLVATSAVLTAVVGLALQDTLGNVASGLTLQLDQSIRLGDWIRVGDVEGRVTEIRWRYTALETRDWETVIVPNRGLVQGQVRVLGRRESEPVQLRRTVSFNVDYRYPPTEVIAAVRAAIESDAIEGAAASPVPHCLLRDFTDSTCRYIVRYWLTDLADEDPTDSRVRTRIYFALRRAGVPLSIPAQAVFITQETRAREERKSRESFERRRDALSAVELFADLPAEDIDELARAMSPVPFADAEVITRQGDEANWLYLLDRGTAAVRVHSDGGDESQVAVLRAGAYFGEMSLLTGEPRQATVVAIGHVECFRLDQSAFKALLLRRPELAEQVADVLARRRVELSAAKEHLDLASQRDRLRDTRTDLVGKIRGFFSLER